MTAREPPEVAAARIEAGRRRARLMETAHRLQARLSPAVLARGAWQGAKEKGADMAENAVDAVRKRPIAATGVVAAIALFLAREPLKGLADKMAGSAAGKRSGKKKTTASKTEAVE